MVVNWNLATRRRNCTGHRRTVCWAGTGSPDGWHGDVTKPLPVSVITVVPKVLWTGGQNRALGNPKETGVVQDSVTTICLTAFEGHEKAGCGMVARFWMSRKWCKCIMHPATLLPTLGIADSALADAPGVVFLLADCRNRPGTVRIVGGRQEPGGPGYLKPAAGAPRRPAPVRGRRRRQHPAASLRGLPAAR